MDQKRRVGVMEWMDQELATDPALRERVESRMAELKLHEDLTALREQRGLTQHQLATLLGVSQPAVARIESGRAQNLTVRTLVRWVTALGGSVKINVQPSAPVVGLRTSAASRSSLRAPKPVRRLRAMR